MRLLMIGAGLGLAVFLLTNRQALQPEPDPGSQSGGAQPALPRASDTPHAQSLFLAPRREEGTGQAAADATKTVPAVETDGHARMRATGEPVVDRGLRDLFDYALTDADRDGPETARERLNQLLAEQGLGERGREAVLHLFDTYLRYRTVAADSLLQNPDADDAARYWTLYHTRREILGPEMAEAFFAGEEAEALALLQDTPREDAAVARTEHLRTLRLEAERLRQRVPEMQNCWNCTPVRPARKPPRGCRSWTGSGHAGTSASLTSCPNGPHSRAQAWRSRTAWPRSGI